MCEVMCVICGLLDYDSRCTCDHLIMSQQHACEMCFLHLSRRWRGIDSCPWPERCPICKGEVD